MKPTASFSTRTALLDKAIRANDAQAVKGILMETQEQTGRKFAEVQAFSLQLITAVNVDHPAVARLLIDLGGFKVGFDDHVVPAIIAKKMQMLDVLIEGGLEAVQFRKNETPGCQFAVLGNAEAFKKAMDKSKDPELFLKKMDREWDSPLTIAVRGESVEFVRELLSLGAVPDYRTVRAAFSSQEERAKDKKINALLEHGLDPNQGALGGFSHLHIAAAGGWVEICKTLIDHGANIHARSSTQSTPLLWASHRPKVVELLIDHGADPSGVNKYGKNLLFCCLAQKKGQFATLCNMIGHDSDLFWGRDNKGDTLLHHLHNIPLEEDGGADLVSFLLQKLGPRWINEINHAGDAPLSVAATAGLKEAARLLIAHGANMEQPDENGKTPLILACEQGRTDAVKVLIMAGANPNAKDQDGRTALDHAVAEPNELVQAILIASGAKMGHMDSRFLPGDAQSTVLNKDNRLVAAMKADDTEFLQHHLKNNPEQGPADIKAALAHLKRKDKGDMHALFSSWLAQKSMDDVLKAHAGANASKSSKLSKSS